MENSEFVLPPPPEDESVFSSVTREYYADEIRRDSTKALIFGLLSIFCCPPIFAYYSITTAQGVVSNIEIYQVEEGRRSMALAGKVLSIIGLAVWVVGILVRVYGR